MFVPIIVTFLARFPIALQSQTMLVTEKALFEVANEICLEKTGYRPLDNNAYFKIVESPEQRNVTFPCAYCGEEGDDVPRIWFWKRRAVDAQEVELEMGLAPDLAENRIFTMPDNSLTIQSVTTNDSGLYYCRSLVEGDFSQFHFSLDIVQREIAVYNQEKKDADADFERFNEKIITKANEKLLDKKGESKFGTEFDKLVVKIVSEWDPWLPCDGCSGIRKRYAKCRIHPKLNIAKYPTLNEDGLSELQKLLLGSIELSCHSLDLAKWFPDLYYFTSSLPNYLRVHQCQDACIKEKSMVYEAKYKLDLRMDAGSSMTFMCPDADLRTNVVWRKDGLIMNPLGPAVKPAKKKKKWFKIPTLLPHIEWKKPKEFDFKHAFIDRMGVLQLCVVGYHDTGEYTCFIDDKPVKTFAITVVTSEETLMERHYHFMLLTVVASTLSGAIVIIGITYGVLQRNQLFPPETPRASDMQTVELDLLKKRQLSVNRASYQEELEET